MKQGIIIVCILITCLVSCIHKPNDKPLHTSLFGKKLIVPESMIEFIDEYFEQAIIL
jgi:hypothetical protein